MDRIDHLVPGARSPVAAGASPGRPADLSWAAGDAAQCDLCFPPRKILLEDGGSVLLPVLVIVAAHSRFITARMIPTCKTESLLLGSWELISSWGRCRGG